VVNGAVYGRGDCPDVYAAEYGAKPYEQGYRNALEHQ
jgi:hypothetical protein